MMTFLGIAAVLGNPGELAACPNGFMLLDANEIRVAIVAVPSGVGRFEAFEDAAYKRDRRARPM